MNVHVTVSIDPDKLKGFDSWRLEQGFKNRSEAIVYLINQAVPEKRKTDEEEAPY